MKNKFAVQKQYYSIADLEKYSGISQRTLRDLLKDPINPIPHYRIGVAGKIVRVKRSEFDEWIKTQRVSNTNDIDRIVDDILVCKSEK